MLSVPKFLPEYPSINDDDFNSKNYRKNEFYSLKLTEEEEEPLKGDLYNHQKIIQRFLSSHTLNDCLLLVWEMGVGKTCGALAVIENLRNVSNTSFKGALIITRGPGIERNFINDLLYKCSPQKYRDALASSLDIKDTEKLLINNDIKKFYSFQTYHFFDNLAKMGANEYKRTVEEYSQYVIVIDEIHNIRLNKKAQKYKQAHRFLHDVKNCKKIIMSGTPMKDDPDEIASILNLLLPLEKQLPLEDEFKDKFLTLRDGIYFIKNNEMKVELKSYMKGIVSYLKTMPSLVHKTFEGETLGNLKFLKVVPVNMSDFQNNAYVKAYALDKEGKKEEDKQRTYESFFKNSTQATLFVYPDGSFGNDGFKKYLASDRKLNLFTGLSKVNSNDTLINNIRTCSAIYGSIFELLVKPFFQNRSHFIYDSLVEGSGCIVLSKLFNMMGYTRITGKEVGDLPPKLRYALLTGKTTDRKLTQNILEVFNSPANMNGKLIHVLIGSDIIMEGFNFKNVQDISITTPYWNYSETAQAFSRGLRLNSHNDLIKAGQVPDVRIYQYVAMPKEIISIDLYLYELSETKDISTKQIERVVKESAFDCGLFYDRNKRPSELDGSRECDYQSCEYQCEGIPSSTATLSPFEIDYSTFDLFYLDDILTDIILKIKKEFGFTFSLSVRELVTRFEKNYNHNPFQTFSALNKIILENIPIKNPNGFIGYLREQKDILFLVDSFAIGSDYVSSLYAKYPVILHGESFDEVMDDIYVPIMIKKLSTSMTQGEFNMIMKLLPLKVQELFDMLLQQADQAETNDATIARTRQFTKSYFSKVVEKKLEVESIPFETDEEVAKIPFPLYGLIDDNNNFLIKRKIPEDVVIVKGSKKPRGLACTSYKVPELIKYMVEFQVPMTNDGIVQCDKKEIDLKTISEAELDDKIQKNKIMNEIVVKYDFKTFDDKRRVFFFYNFKNAKDRCLIFKDWFKANKALLRVLPK